MILLHKRITHVMHNCDVVVDRRRRTLPLLHICIPSCGSGSFPLSLQPVEKLFEVLQIVSVSQERLPYRVHDLHTNCVLRLLRPAEVATTARPPRRISPAG